MTTKVDEILRDVSAERVWQKLRWGDEHDACHELDDWIRFIDKRLYELHEQDGILTPLRRRLLFVKIAALAAAAIEALGAKDG